MSTRFRICLAIWIVTVLCTAFGSTVSAEEFAVTDDWSVEISPAYMASDFDKAVVNDTVAISADGEAVESDGEVPLASQPCHSGYCPQDYRVHDYRRIYESIPFNRAEYNVNPSYRHDSTMELLTGNARHQTIVRHDRSTSLRPQYTMYRYRLGSRYNARRRGLSNYFWRHRVDSPYHYFYSPYWNFRGIY